MIIKALRLFVLCVVMQCSLVGYFTSATAQQVKKSPPVFAGEHNTAPTAQPTQDAETARVKSEIKSILSSSEYKENSNSESDLSKKIKSYTETLRKNYEAVKRWIQNLYGKIQRLFGGLRGVKGSGNLFIILFLVICTAAILFFLWRYFKNPRGKKRTAAASQIAEGTLDDELVIEALSKSPEEWASIAAGFAANAEYRRAIRALFLRMICLLDRRSILEFQPSQTNRGLTATLSTRNTLIAGSFETMVQMYEAVWYGELEGVSNTYQSMQLLGTGIETAIQNTKVQLGEIGNE